MQNEKLTDNELIAMMYTLLNEITEKQKKLDDLKTEAEKRNLL